MSCKGYKKPCWLKASKNSLCNTCDSLHNQDVLSSILNPFNATALQLHMKKPTHLSIINTYPTFDTFAKLLYKRDKPFLLSYLNTFKERLIDRVYTHSNTDLCNVYCWLLHTKSEISEELPMPNSCLRCLAHTLRYGDKYMQSLILKSVVLYYDDGPHIQTLIHRKPSDMALIEFGSAIIETQGVNGVFGAFLDMIREKTDVIEYLQLHPFLHKTTLSDTNLRTLKQNLYLYFKFRKRIFYEELFVKAYHPSRHMQWCFDEEDKEGFSEIPTYIFTMKKAAWDVFWDANHNPN